MKLYILLKAINTQTEIDQQIELVQKFIDDRVDAIVLVPIDSKALVPITVKAIKAGIKVINIDIRLDEELLREAQIELTYVGPDNKSASKMVGDVLAKKVGSGAKVMLIEGLSVAENAQQRKAGFLESIEEYSLQLLASEPANWETHTAKEVFGKLIQQFPDVQGVFCSNDAMALGVLQCLKEKGQSGSIPVVGFDNDPSAQPFLKSGEMLATIDAFGAQMAVEGIRYALKILAGELENKGSYSTEYKLIK